MRTGRELGDVELPPGDERRHGASLSEEPDSGASSAGSGSAWTTVRRRDRSGEHDVEPSQAGPLVGLGGGDGGRLDHDDPVELQALGHGGRDDVDLVVDVAVVLRRARRARFPCRCQRLRQLRDTRSSATMTPIEPRLGQLAGDDRRRARRAARRRRRVDEVEPARVVTDRHREPRPGAMCGSSCAAYSMTLAGTRKPAVQHLDVAARLAEVVQRGLPGVASPTGWCPGRCRRARSPSRSSTAGRRRAAASATGPAPRRARRGRATGCAAMWSPSSSSSTASAARPAGGSLGARPACPTGGSALLVLGQEVLSRGAPATSASESRRERARPWRRAPATATRRTSSRRRCGPRRPAPGRPVSRPRRSICSSTACASRCGSICRAAS